jgi:hypothetical protein
VKPTAVAVALAIVLPALPARAAPASATEQSYRTLERESGLDLSRAWAKYNEQHRSRPFGAYVDRRYRIRRDLGRGFVVAGASLLIAATFFLCFGVTTTTYDRMNYGVTGATASLGGGMLISGAVLWGVFGPKVDRLDTANDKLQYGVAFTTPRGRLQVRPGGLGVRLAF